MDDTYASVLLSEMLELQRQLYEAFHRYETSMEHPVAVGQAWRPLVDIAQDEERLYVELDAPGVHPQGLRVEYHKGVLVIVGSKPEKSLRNKPRYHCFERTYGVFRRHIALPRPVDVEHIEATLDHGVLTITLKKMPERDAKPIIVPVKYDDQGHNHD